MVSSEVERGRVGGQALFLPTWDKQQTGWRPQTSPHQPHPQHSSSAEPSEATMPRTLERLGSQPSSHQMPQDLGVSVVSVWDSEP